jgi:hypothetical protein
MFHSLTRRLGFVSGHVSEARYAKDAAVLNRQDKRVRKAIKRRGIKALRQALKKVNWE